MLPFRIFIGYDQVETVAWHVLTESILRRSSIPVQFAPVKQSLLNGVYSRERDPRQSNEFSFTRFLTPYLADYHGWALFMDCDMMLRCDIADLLQDLDPSKSVYVCKHDYVPKNTIKYLGAVQYAYPRKNWSSFMLFNCSHQHTKRLTPDTVNSVEPAYLHRMQWTEDDRIGSLPLEWNWLAGEYPYNPDAKVVHWTVGGPWNTAYAWMDYADEWFAELAKTTFALSDADVCKGGAA